MSHTHKFQDGKNKFGISNYPDTPKLIHLIISLFSSSSSSSLPLLPPSLPPLSPPLFLSHSIEITEMGEVNEVGLVWGCVYMESQSLADTRRLDMRMFESPEIRRKREKERKGEKE